MIIEIYDTVAEQLVKIDLDAPCFQPLNRLPEAINQYFLEVPGAQLVGTSTLLPTRARPQGVRNANALMLDARAGRISRRKPIAISRDVVFDRRLVVDGNSTLLNAIYSGWTKIYAMEY